MGCPHFAIAGAQGWYLREWLISAALFAVILIASAVYHLRERLTRRTVRLRKNVA